MHGSYNLVFSPFQVVPSAKSEYGCIRQFGRCNVHFLHFHRRVCNYSTSPCNFLPFTKTKVVQALWCDLHANRHIFSAISERQALHEMHGKLYDIDSLNAFPSRVGYFVIGHSFLVNELCRVAHLLLIVDENSSAVDVFHMGFIAHLMYW